MTPDPSWQATAFMSLVTLSFVGLLARRLIERIGRRR